MSASGHSLGSDFVVLQLEKKKSTWCFEKKFKELLEFGMNKATLQTIKDYINYLEGRDAVETTKAQACHKMMQFYSAVNGFKPKDLVDKKKGAKLILDYKKWMKNRGLAPYTIAVRLLDIRTFVYWFCRNNDLAKPKYLLNSADIRIRKPLSSRVTEENVLEFNEVKSLWQVDAHPRNKAMLITAFESGMRLQELLDLRLKDLREKKGTKGDYFEATFNVQKGEKNKRINSALVWSHSFLSEWLSIHPLKENENAFLFCNLKNVNTKARVVVAGAQMRKATAHRVIVGMAKKAGIKKPVSWHRIRHAAITYELLNGYNEMQVKAKHGYTKGSQILSNYSHLTSKRVRDKELIMKGIEPSKNNGKEEPVLIYCPRCKTRFEESQQFCPKCGYNTDFEESLEREQIMDKIGKETIKQWMKEIMQEKGGKGNASA